jgi:hypothetical protein
MRSAMPLVLLVLAPGLDAFAQDLALQPGQRVRVTAPTEGLRRKEGRFEKLQRDSLLVVSVDGQTRVLPLRTVTLLEQVHGRRRHPLPGMGIGIGIGALAGGAAGYAAGEDRCSRTSFFCLTRGESTGLGAAGGAIVGGLLGLAVGAVWTTDRWADVPVDRLRVRVVPQRGGFRLGASIAF